MDNAHRDDGERGRQRAEIGDALTRALGYPTSFIRDRSGFLDDTNEWRRMFAELLGTFFLVLVAVGSGMVNARFGGHAVSTTAQAITPGLMVGAIILFMGSVSGAHLNPAVTLAFAMRRDFPWKRVPAYLIAQAVGAVLAVFLLVALLERQGTAGLTRPGAGISTTTALLWEVLLTTGLVSTILGTASGAQNVGALNAIGVGGYIALSGLWAAPVSGASMNIDRSLAAALALHHWDSWWAYALGPPAGALIAVGISWILRGPGGGFYGKRAAEGALGWLWQPGPIHYEPPSTPEQAGHIAPGPPPGDTTGPTAP